MVTQTIKNWLRHLFAWWPWKRTATTAYALPSQNGIMGISQEHLLSVSSDGSVPQAGTMSVIVEQTNENTSPEVILPLPSLSVEYIDTIAQSITLKDLSSSPCLAPDEQVLEELPASVDPFDGETTPIPTQQMAFLKYLVSRGLVNEGFEEGYTPEQYRPKK